MSREGVGAVNDGNKPAKTAKHPILTPPRIGIFTVCAYEHMPAERLYLLQHNLIPSLRRQIYRDFDVIVTSRADQNGKLCGIGSDASDEAVHNLHWGGLRYQLAHADSVPYHDYTIQIRVDSDDVLLPTFALKCAALWYEHAGLDEFLASFVFYEYSTATRTLRGGIRRWNENRPSMFAALFQRQTPVQKYIRALGPHHQLGQHVPKVINVEEGHCVWMRHESQFVGDYEAPTTYEMEVTL